MTSTDQQTQLATVPVEIKNRWSGDVLFIADVSASIAEGLRIKAAVEIVVKAGANLARANLARAYLARAYLDGANLAGANLDDKSTLAGQRPIFQIGPIGSASRYFVAYITTSGLRLRAGCFFGTRDQFLKQVDETHGTSVHGQEYRAALTLIDAHCALWAPADKDEEVAA